MPALEVRPVPIEQTRELRRQVLRPHQTLEQIAAHEPSEDAFAAGAFEDGRLIAVGYVMRDGGPGAWRVRGMSTLPERRNRGAGGAVLAELIRHAAEQGATRIWCNARVGAQTLYARAGFAVASEEFELPEIGMHVLMERHGASQPSK